MRKFDITDELSLGLVGENSILDTGVRRIAIFEADYTLTVEIEFAARPRSDFSVIKLVFIGVSEFSFYYRSDFAFYEVERVKLFRTEDALYYLSLDPADEEIQVSKDDQDFVLAERVEAYVEDRTFTGDFMRDS